MKGLVPRERSVRLAAGTEGDPCSEESLTWQLLMPPETVLSGDFSNVSPNSK